MLVVPLIAGVILLTGATLVIIKFKTVDRFVRDHLMMSNIFPGPAFPSWLFTILTTAIALLAGIVAILTGLSIPI